LSAGGVKRGLTVLKPLLPRLGAVRFAPLPTIALFVALSVTGCSSGHETAGVAVPWVNRPLPRYEVPAPQVIPYPTSSPPCHASELRIAQGRGGAAAGTLYERLVFTNIGRRTCLLRGYPTITALAPDGGRRPLRPHREGFTFFYLVPANLPPRGHSFIGLATGDGCDNGTKPTTSYRQLSVTIPHRETVQAGASVRITEACGLFVSSFGLPARYTPLAPAAGTPATATLRVHLPGRVRAGTILRYTITLANPTQTTITLRPCPGYSEGIYASGLVVRRSLALNCDTVHAIGAHEQVRYAMQLAVPTRAAAGIAKFSWSLNDPNGPFAGRIIRITRR
jgi:hypothetical protein